MNLLTVVGARPQFIKAAVVSREVRERCRAGTAICERIVHTGQHFDANMSAVFFEQMDIPQPQVNLGIAGGSHGRMTGRMLEALEGPMQEFAPDWVLVYGDTNSTLAGALAAAKLHIPVAHVEAGLRSFNRRMPEEINRIVADRLSDLLLAPTEAAVKNLRAEGIPAQRIRRVGDVMFDAVLHYRGRAAQQSRILNQLDLAGGGYVLATVHRAENTDDPRRLAGIIQGLAAIARTLPVVLPIHPRTQAALGRHRLEEAARPVRIVPPVGYLDMIALEAGAALVATDSGGVQKEAYFNRVPCLTLRDETEWVELIEIGANRLVGADPLRIESGFRDAIAGPVAGTGLYGTGNAAAEIVDELLLRTAPRTARPSG